jgi:hypothetical protein
MPVTWTLLKNQPPQPASAMWLMQDGSILANLYQQKQLVVLRPDEKGSYVHGKWSNAGNLLLQRLFFASAVLSDGRVIVCGGEFTGASFQNQTESNNCEIFDLFNGGTSVQINAPTGWGNIGDAPSVVLNDGTFMLGNQILGLSNQAALLDPCSLSWTFAGGDGYQEETWVLLQTGDVITTSCIDKTTKRYNAGTNAPVADRNKFVSDKDLPVMIGNNADTETGPAITMMDGRVIFFGAKPGHTCIYTPGAEGHDGRWVQGPDLPTNPANGDHLRAADVPAMLEPNGKVLVLTQGKNTPSAFVEYNPHDTSSHPHGSFTILPGAPTCSECNVTRMLLLPNGHGLISVANSGNWYDLKFDTGGHASWAPAITSFPHKVQSGSTVTLAGTQLCGLSECQSFGDDNQQAENYPIVRFVDSNHNVTYARAHDVSMRSIAPGKEGSVLVDIPSLEPGEYSVYVVAMGIPCAPRTVTVLPSWPRLDGLVGDMDGDGKDETFVTSPWGVAILKKSGHTMDSLTVAASGTRLEGGWELDSVKNSFGPVGDYDFDGRDEILVRSAWGIAYLKLKRGVLTSVALTANGTDLAKGDTTQPHVAVPLNAMRDTFGPVFSPDGQTTFLFYTNCAGAGSVSFGESLTGGIVPWGTEIPGGWKLEKGDIFGPMGDFDGSGSRGQIFVAGQSGVAILDVSWSFTIAQAANGTFLPGGWKIDTKTTQFLAGGLFVPAGGGDIRDTVTIDLILAVSDWGIGVLLLGEGSWETGLLVPPGSPVGLVTAAMVRNGSELGGWVLDTALQKFGPTAALVTPEEPPSRYVLRTPSYVVVTGPQGLGALSVSRASATMTQIATDGTLLGGWTLDIHIDRFGSTGNFEGGGQSEIFATSPSGIAILSPSGSTFKTTMMQLNGARLGQWLLDTTNDKF